MESLFNGLCSVYFVGIKGTGVCALAELMQGMGIKVSGSDIAEVFYTDAVLKNLGIPYHESFDPAHITDDIELVIFSAAYSRESNSELAEAYRKSIPLAAFPKALGMFSAAFDSTGITGVHGKTTTTAMCGTLMQGLGIPAQILAGSAVANFGGKSTLVLGKKYFIAETCEYRRHFLNFCPRRVILTSVESDHQDCFPTYESIRDAFADYCRLIPPDGELIYCADDPGAGEVAGIIRQEDRGITLIPYGFCAPGDFRITSYRVADDRAMFSINSFSVELHLHIPGRHQVLNAAAAIALASVLSKKEGSAWGTEQQLAVRNALGEFRGSKRRSEIIGHAGGIIFMDDYGHHPTEIQTTLQGLREFFPSRRIVMSFMSHTYTRTASLLDDFASALAAADVLFLHKIYASAREQFHGSIDGMSLNEKTALVRGSNADMHYIDEPLDACRMLTAILKPGDLFITMGAGNNWPLGVKLFEHFLQLDGGAS